MVIYTTLKDNLNNGNDYWDIIIYVEECFIVVADLFPNAEKYYDRWNETDTDKLQQDYTDRQIASACLKYLRSLCKGKKPLIMQWNKCFIELDGDGEIAYDQLEYLINNKIITNSNQLREIENKAERKGTVIKKGTRYGENDIYFKYLYISNLIDKYF